jgi:phosphoesterase RecJ-like protein
MNETFNAILEQIKSHDTIIIHRHQSPDPDAIGSQGGLREVLRASFPEKRVLATGVNEDTLAYMTQMDDVKDEDYKDALVIVVDTANRPRIDDDRWDTGNFLIKIDHHPDRDVYGDISWVNTDASSASEIIAQFTFDMGLTMPDEGARLLFAGIVGDTGRFLYPATSSLTFSIAADLRGYDFDFAGLGRTMDSFDMNIARLQGFMFENLEVDENGAAQMFLTLDDMKRFGVTPQEAGRVVSTPGKINTIETWVLFYEQEPTEGDDNKYRVHFRSKTKQINQIAEAHNGGGHPLASGARAKDDAEAAQIYKEVQAIFK